MREAKHQPAGVITLRRENFNSLPSFLGENDPMRAVQMQPGVQSGNEGSRGIFIRGGSPDQNLMLLDGAPVYNPSHVYGFISVFNGDAVDRIDIFKNTYPSKFGGRLCSVLDLKMDEGDSAKLHGTFSFGLVTSRLHLNGPLTKKKQTTFSFSARGCYVGLYTSPISKRQYSKSGYTGNIYYYFADVNAKIVHRFSVNTKLELNFFTNNDIYVFIRNSNSDYTPYHNLDEVKHQINWANYVSSAALTHRFNDVLSFTNRISFSRYIVRNEDRSYYEQTSDVDTSYRWLSESSAESKSYINDISWRSDLVFETEKQKFSAGAGLTGLIFETGKGTYRYENPFIGSLYGELKNGEVKSLDAFLYGEEEYHFSEKFSVSAGFHTRVYTVQKKTFVSFLPRAHVLYNPVAKFFLRASVSGLSQNMHLLATSSSDILNDLWVPATANAKPENGWNYSAGMLHKLPLGFEWSIDGFYRHMENLIEYKDGAESNSASKPWSEQIVTGGKGRSYGAEIYFARAKGRITGSIAYTLAWSQRKFAELSNGNFYPYKYDRRHNVAAQINFLIGKHFEIGASWVYGSGNMYTLPLQSYHSWIAAYWHNINVSQGVLNDSYSELITLYNGKNNFRLPAYHHLDISFTYRLQKKNLEHAFNISVYNIYNRFNIFSVYSDYRSNPDGSRSIVFKQLSLFPVLPSVLYTIKFVQ